VNNAWVRGVYNNDTASSTRALPTVLPAETAVDVDALRQQEAPKCSEWILEAKLLAVLLQ